MSDREINLRSVLFLVIGILLLLSLVICVYIVGSESDLVPIEATVINSKKSDDGSEKYDITLEYDVDGKSYKYTYQDKEGLEIDKSVELYYHSKNVTSVRENKTSKLIFVCPLIGLITCIIGLLELFKKNNREPKVDYQTSVIGVIGDTKQLKIITEDTPVHQYEKTPEEMAETQVKSIKKDTDDTVTHDIAESDLAFESITDREDVEQIEDSYSDEKVIENDNNDNNDDPIEISTVQVQQDIFVPKAPVIQNVQNLERTIITPIVVEEPDKVEEKTVSEEPLVIQDEPVKQEMEVEEETIQDESVDEKVQENKKNEVREEHSDAFQQLMEKVNQIQAEEQQKIEEVSNNNFETQTIPVEEVKQKIEEDNEISTDNETNSQNEIADEIQKVAKENDNLGEDDIKKMINDALKEVISEKSVDEKEDMPVVQKRVLPNYFYISGTSLVYEESGKEAKELSLKTVKDVVRTINSEGKVVKIVVSNDEVKCILTNMKNIDLEQVANLLHNKMSTIDKNFKEVIEYKEY